MKQSIDKIKIQQRTLTLFNMVWIFIVFSLIGVVGEGIWTVLFSGHWETHVVNLGVPLCILYGMGAVVFYICDYFMKGKNIFIKFIVTMLGASLVELLAGLVMEFGLKMSAWSYKGEFLNIRGHICLYMSLLWGVLGVGFSYLLVPPIDKVLTNIQCKTYNIISWVVTVLLVIDFALTTVAILRWKDRHYSVPPKTEFGELIDRTFDDDFMEKRFVEWSFRD